MPWHIEEEARENPSWLAAMMINLNRFALETQSIPRNFGLGSASCRLTSSHSAAVTVGMRGVAPGCSRTATAVTSACARHIGAASEREKV